MELRSLDAFAAATHGLITRAAAGRLGMSRTRWYRALERGELEQLHPGVARLVGSPRTREQRIAAAVLAAGPEAVASHRSAAHLWGVPRLVDDPVDVTLADRRRQATLVDVAVHRPRDHADLAPTWRAGIPTSSVVRFLCDLGAVDPRGVPAAVEHVVMHGLVSPAELHAAVDAHARRGRQGVPALRAALRELV